jgi:hypothetical protein
MLLDSSAAFVVKSRKNPLATSEMEIGSRRLVWALFAHEKEDETRICSTKRPNLTMTFYVSYFLWRRAGDLFVLVYSVDSRESFEEVLRLRDQIIETKCHLSGTGGASSAAANTRNLVIGTKKANTPRPVPMVIAGNKCDKDMKYVSCYILCLDCSN